MNLREKFAMGEESCTHVRIDKNYKVNIFVGYNEKRQMSIVIAEFGQAVRIKSSKVIEVQMRKRNDGRIALSFELVDNSYKSMFFVFCKDLIIVCEKAGCEMALSNAVARWNYWKGMFKAKRSSILSEKDIKDLIGKLVEFRDYLVPKYGMSVALEGWIGTVPRHKYFEMMDTWCEVETIDQDAVKVMIRSLEQLDAEEEGVLVIVRLENANIEDNDALNLNTMVVDIADKIENPKELNLFQAKINNTGYCINPEYDNYNFIVKDIQRYKVNEEFPCLRKSKISSSIEDARYTLLLDGIIDFREE